MKSCLIYTDLQKNHLKKSLAVNFTTNDFFL
jgi:hypothetical protein